MIEYRLKDRYRNRRRPGGPWSPVCVREAPGRKYHILYVDQMDLNVRAYCGFELKDMHTLMSEWVEGYLAGFAYRVCVEPTEICLNCGQAYARAGVAAKKAKKKNAALARKDVQRKLVEEESEDPAVFVHWASRRRKG